MTERRPHWTDELIEAVSTTIVQPDGQVGYWDTEATCDVIAVVEDWMIGKDTKLAPAGTTPEAAIARVLALHAPAEYPDLPYPICEHCTGDSAYQWWPCPTVQAIRGHTPAQGVREIWPEDIDEMAADLDEHGHPRLLIRLKPEPEHITITVQPETCGDAWEDEDSFGYCHECRLPKGHSGDHVCANQDDDQDACHWHNWNDTPQP